MIAACKKANLPNLEFKNFSGGFILTFYKAKQQTDANGITQEEGSNVPVTDAINDPVGDPVLKLLLLLKDKPLNSKKIRDKLGLKHRASFRKNYLHPALHAGLIERTIPSKPNSRLQQYRLTEKGKKELV